MNRLTKITKSLSINLRAITIARAGISSANHSNPFWGKSEAFIALNIARKNARKLYRIFELECKLQDIK